MLARPAVIIAAHPDDEVLGLGSLLPHFRNLRAIIHATDGAPRRGSDIANAGVSSWQEYASLRRRELEAVIAKSGVPRVELICLGYPDQEVSFHIARLAKSLAALFQRFRVAAVFTHPYEGGHPDHDACAAAVQFARSFMDENEPPAAFEFSSYHAAGNGGMETERFLNRGSKTWQHTLSEEEQQEKRELLAAYKSQQRVLGNFPLREEPIRMSPEYDFRKAPHRGKLYYENFDWGVNGYKWRWLARRAMNQLGISMFV